VSELVEGRIPETTYSQALPRGVLARYFNPFRLAAYVLVLYTAGHTLGAVIATPEFGPASDSVVSMMKSVHVVAQGSDTTWYGLYRGFGWFVSVFFAFSIIVTWYVGGKTAAERVTFTPITWSLFVSHAAGGVIAWVYFFLTPILCSTAIAVLLGIGGVRDWAISRGANGRRPQRQDRNS
jgi:hypothetical protein